MSCEYREIIFDKSSDQVKYIKNKYNSEANHAEIKQRRKK